MSRKRSHRKVTKPTANRAVKRSQKTPHAAIEFIHNADGSASITSYSPGAQLIDPDARRLAKNLDMEWFRSHPQRSHRLRRAIVGEAPTKVTPNTYIVVRQIRPGYNERVTFEA